MHIAINMPDLANFDFRSAAKVWLQKKDASIILLQRLESKVGLRGVFKGKGNKKTNLKKILTNHLKGFSFNNSFADK